jgi:hypothetical protein
MSGHEESPELRSLRLTNGAKVVPLGGRATVAVVADETIDEANVSVHLEASFEIDDCRSGTGSTATFDLAGI